MAAVCQIRRECFSMSGGRKGRRIYHGGEEEDTEVTEVYKRREKILCIIDVVNYATVVKFNLSGICFIFFEKNITSLPSLMELAQ